MYIQMMYPSLWYADFYHWWYNFLGVSMHFMSTIPDVWRGNIGYPIYHWFDGTLYLLASASGNFISMISGEYAAETMQNTLGIIGITMIIGIIFDYLILSEISDFYKRKNIATSHNRFFVYFYVLWRVIMPDIFLASTFSALGCKITLSRKNIFLLAILAQILRFLGIVILWCIFGLGWIEWVINVFI